ncbi:MAG: chitin synthase-domain-containing protein, partial [Olpidium bornovanus]
MAADVASYKPTTFPHRFVIHGRLYEFRDDTRRQHSALALLRQNSSAVAAIDAATGVDVSVYFPPPVTTCSELAVKAFSVSCSLPQFDMAYCHSVKLSDPVMKYSFLGEIAYQWSDISRPPDGRKLFAYNGIVLDVTRFLKDNDSFLGQWVQDAVESSVGTDATIRFGSNKATRAAAACLQSLYAAGVVSTKTVGCFISDIILYTSLVAVLGVVVLKFVLAVIFSWFMSRELGRLQEKRNNFYRNRNRGSKSYALVRKSRDNLADRQGSLPLNQSPHHVHVCPGTPGSGPTRFGTIASPANSRPLSAASSPQLSAAVASFGGAADTQVLPDELAPFPTVEEARDLRNIHTIMLVTCYSEGEESLRCTLDSLTCTDYSPEHKLIVVIADGLIQGEGNPKSTPQLLVDMLELDPTLPNPPEPMIYCSIVDGAKRHNKAQIYVGVYRCGGKWANAVVIVKCGTEGEKGGEKPGNRGKRDSQVILMRFFQKVIFNDPMTPLEYDLFCKIRHAAKVTADAYEILLMVDADTKVLADSVTRMVLCMARDPEVMGLCGETRIANKRATWVTRIQVFEYHISHHLGKAFESIFGGVTCLPGCFCMYRIKAPKGDGNRWVPIIASPAVIDEYRVNVVDTLHKKNLLLLGEDRFLTTVMLRKFPKRKMIFVPKAVCK